VSIERRKHEILELVNQKGKMTIADLGKMFDVSDMTIRRDLRDLDKIGLLRRFHGGAVSSIGRSYEPAYNLRAMTKLDAKKAIGRKAAELVQDGDSIGIDTGTTTLELVHSLKDKRNLTILTSSLTIANEVVSTFSLLNEVRLILTGGIVRANELSMVGDIAHGSYQALHVDKAFLGVGGISLEAGITEYNLDDAAVKKAMLKSAQQKIVLADSSKLGRTRFGTVCTLTEVDCIVTDNQASSEIVDEFSKLGVEVVIAV
jgi:DeoR/GlpR family transcriptional regulator of sugar metabolism